MKITKKQLKKIIKEEKFRLLNEQLPAGVQEGVSRGMYIAAWRTIEEHAEDLQLDLEDPSILLSIASALEGVARELKDKARGPTR